MLPYIPSFGHVTCYHIDMKLIIGLGNPGENYSQTRHNVGWRVLDEFAKDQELSFKPQKKFFSDIAEMRRGGEKVLFAKPTTFYNDVGKAFLALTQFYNLVPSDVLVIHDELALSFGTIRTRVGGSDAGNNGIKSINLHGGEHTARIRVGVANPQRATIGDTDFVIGKFSREETNVVSEHILPTAIAAVESFITDSFEETSRTLRLDEPE